MLVQVPVGLTVVVALVVGGVVVDFVVVLLDVLVGVGVVVLVGAVVVEDVVPGPEPPPPAAVIDGAEVPKDGEATQVVTWRPCVNEFKPSGPMGSGVDVGRVPT
jgi:hypothetical protein